jgi:hypothetical protein
LLQDLTKGFVGIDQQNVLGFAVWMLQWNFAPSLFRFFGKCPANVPVSRRRMTLTDCYSRESRY